MRALRESRRATYLAFAEAHERYLDLLSTTLIPLSRIERSPSQREEWIEKAHKRWNQALKYRQNETQKIRAVLYLDATRPVAEAALEVTMRFALFCDPPHHRGPQGPGFRHRPHHAATAGLHRPPDGRRAGPGDARMTHMPARYALVDTELGGQRIIRGEPLILGLAAANTDPRIHTNDPEREIGNRSHLGFNAGPHQCPARTPARLIARVAVEQALHGLPRITLGVPADAVTSSPSPWMRHLESLPVTFAPAGNTAPDSSVR